MEKIAKELHLESLKVREMEERNGLYADFREQPCTLLEPLRRLTGKLCFVQSFTWFYATMDVSDMSSGRLSGDQGFVASLTAKVANLRLAITPGASSNDICLSAASVAGYV